MKQNQKLEKPENLEKPEKLEKPGNAENGEGGIGQSAGSAGREHYAAVFGSPGARVRFVGFFSIFWPFLVVIFLAGLLIGQIFPGMLRPAVAGGALVVLAASAWYAFSVASARFASYLKGAQGEEAVARELALLPEGWDVFHGVPRGHFDPLCTSGDFDHIVVGPDTLFVIETKNWEGPIVVEHGVMRVRGRTPNRSPVAQVRREAGELAGLLREAMPEGVVITPIICFANNSFSSDEGQIDDVYLCNARQLRTLILETSGGCIDELHRKLILDCLSQRVGL